MSTAGLPVVDLAAASTLGEALRDLGYTEDRLDETLGDGAYAADRDDRHLFARRLDGSALAVAARLLFLELPVGSREAARALGRRALDAVAALGLADVGEEVVPRGRVTAIGDVLLCSDGYTRGLGDPPDYVATYTPAARRCDALTPRPRGKRAMDVGAGSGIHALLAARHTRQVVATDVNDRALAFTRVNAALNAVDNVETRAGSFFDPVDGELFDLIVCNAPYVISPETRWVYRDSRLEGDEVSERAVRGAAALLDEGGYTTVLVSWIEREGDDAFSAPLGWIDGSGCDAWILDFDAADPLDHAAAWNAELLGDDDAYTDALDSWARYLDGLGALAVHEGAVLLRRRDGARNTVRCDEADADEIDRADRQIRRAFEARARLAELPRRDDVLDAVLRPAPALRVEHELVPGGRQRAWIRLDEGTYPVVDASPEVADVFLALDGRRALRSFVGDASPRRVAATARELLELGALRFAGR